MLLYRFRNQFATFQILTKQSTPRFVVRREDLYPCLSEATSATLFDRHYIYHPAWAARVLAQTQPAEHIDISSHLSFCAIVSAFVPVRFYDYRPADLQLSGLQSLPADLMALPFADNSLPSLSCMHTVEHVGLGRYGDPLDPDGDVKAIAELRRVVAPGGSLLFVVPVGRPRLQFNAHRIYSYAQVAEQFAGWQVREFALIQDDAKGGGLLTHNAAALVEQQFYGCGCFWLQKQST